MSIRDDVRKYKILTLYIDVKNLKLDMIQNFDKYSDKKLTEKGYELISRAEAILDEMKQMI